MMNGKKVTFGTKPRTTPTVKDADAWVSGREITQTPPMAPQEDEAVQNREAILQNREAIKSREKTKKIPLTQAKNDKEDIKRLTIDMPEELHRRVKSGCALRGEKIADVVRKLLEQHFPAE